MLFAPRSPVTRQDVISASGNATGALDTSFFHVRFDQPAGE